MPADIFGCRVCVCVCVCVCVAGEAASHLMSRDPGMLLSVL